jgi:hypothetical protein
MAVLNGGGSGGVRWMKANQMAVGEKVRGAFVDFQAGLEGKFGPEDILTLEDGDGVAIKLRCPAALSRVFKANTINVGTGVVITYKGKGVSKAGKQFHNYEVETVEADASFGFGASVVEGAPVTAATTEDPELNALEQKLAAARARRAQQPAA